MTTGPGAPAPDGRTALLLGATGLVGGHCLELLLADPRYRQVRALVRRPLERKHPKLDATVVDFERLDDAAGLVAGDDVFCCVGTTLRTAGSREAFRRVDFGYTVETARRAVENGAEQLLLVSATGADAASRVFYQQVKGETEDAVRALPFCGVTVVRPSLLRGRAEVRRGERIGEVVLGILRPLLRGPLRRIRPVWARDVAAALVRCAGERRPGVRIVESDAISRGEG